MRYGVHDDGDKEKNVFFITNYIHKSHGTIKIPFIFRRQNEFDKL